MDAANAGWAGCQGAADQSDEREYGKDCFLHDLPFFVTSYIPDHTWGDEQIAIVVDEEKGVAREVVGKNLKKIVIFDQRIKIPSAGSKLLGVIIFYGCSYS